jgi:hypothetical protein
VTSTRPSHGFDPARLPVFSPDPALWSRIVCARRAAVRRQRWRIGVAGLAAAAGVTLAVLALPRPMPPAQHALADRQRESRQLEAMWLSLAPPKPEGLVQLHGIDAALQAAYDHGAPADELAPLWQQRNLALRGLVARAQSGANRGPTRI